jgi:hypothetical protein
MWDKVSITGLNDLDGAAVIGTDGAEDGLHKRDFPGALGAGTDGAEDGLHKRDFPGALGTAVLAGEVTDGAGRCRRRRFKRNGRTTKKVDVKCPGSHVYESTVQHTMVCHCRVATCPIEKCEDEDVWKTRTLHIPAQKVSGTANDIIGKAVWHALETYCFGSPLRDFVRRKLAPYGSKMFVFALDKASGNMLLTKKNRCLLQTDLFGFGDLALWQQICGLHRVGRTLKRILKSMGVDSFLYAISRSFDLKKNWQNSQRCFLKQLENTELHDVAGPSDGVLFEMYKQLLTIRWQDTHKPDDVATAQEKAWQCWQNFFLHETRRVRPGLPCAHGPCGAECQPRHTAATVAKDAKKTWRNCFFMRRPERYNPSRWAKQTPFMGF